VTIYRGIWEEKFDLLHDPDHLCSAKEISVREEIYQVEIVPFFCLNFPESFFHGIFFLGTGRGVSELTEFFSSGSDRGKIHWSCRVFPELHPHWSWRSWRHLAGLLGTGFWEQVLVPNPIQSLRVTWISLSPEVLISA
jgi:hypothetical protein